LRKPDIARDERFSNSPRRLENREVLEAEIGDIFDGLTSEEVVWRLEDAGIASARMRTVREFSEHPQLEARPLARRGLTFG
jgi:itaconate CoA-transferase